MHKRPPWRTVAFDQHFTGREGISNQVVDDKVAAQARGHTISGGIAQECWAERLVGKRADIAFDEHFGFAVGRDRVEAGAFIEKVITRGAIQTAGRRKDEARHTGLFGEASQAHGGAMIDFVRQAWIQIAERIIG